MLKYQVFRRKFTANDADVLCQKCLRHEFILVVNIYNPETLMSTYFMTTDNSTHIKIRTYLHYWTGSRIPACLGGFEQVMEVEV